MWCQGISPTRSCRWTTRGWRVCRSGPSWNCWIRCWPAPAGCSCMACRSTATVPWRGWSAGPSCWRGWSAAGAATTAATLRYGAGRSRRASSIAAPVDSAGCDGCALRLGGREKWTPSRGPYGRADGGGAEPTACVCVCTFLAYWCQRAVPLTSITRPK